MKANILARAINPTVDSNDPATLVGALARAGAELDARARVFALERLVRDARDLVAHSSALLDLFVDERDRAIWTLEQFGALTGEATHSRD